MLPGAEAAGSPLLTSNSNPHRRVTVVVVDISTWLLSFFSPHICFTHDPKMELRMKLLVFEWRKRMWWRVISEPGLFAHIATPFYRNSPALLPSQVSPPVCLSVRTPWWCEEKLLGRITQARRSRKPSLQRGCIEEAFMWLLSLGLQRPAQFGVASLNFITMRFYSVVVRVYV